MACPACRSADKTLLPSVCREIVFADPRGTSKGDNFGYVAGHNMAQAQEERRKAEEASHMGGAPYRQIDDISGGTNFDPGKW